MRLKDLLTVTTGFSLIEVMITLVLMSVSLLALAGLQMKAIKGNALSKRMTTAISIAEERLEQIKNTPYASIQSQTAQQVTVASSNFTRQVTVTNNSPLPNTKTVEVIVTWHDGAKSYTVPLSSIITQ
jgi:type IV pilus assembly protein PilV